MIAYECPSGVVYSGDCLSIMPQLAEGCGQAIVTDPPYGRKALPLYDGLLSNAGHVLSPGGNLVAILPHYALPEIFRMEAPDLRFRWQLSMRQTTGSWPRLCNGARTVLVTGKPMGWWIREPWPKNDYRSVVDGFDMPYERKKLHEWQQAEAWAVYCIENFSDPGDTIVDPFLGSGTTAVVATRMGRRFIGIELDPQALQTAVERIDDECAAAVG